MKRIVPILLAAVVVCACPGPVQNATDPGRETYTNPIYPSGSSPFLIRHAGSYYYTQTMNDHVSIWKASRISELSSAKEHVVYAPAGIYHFSSPCLHWLDGKWYLYFSSDDGTGRDIRHIYIMENPAEDPLEGSFVMKGWFNTGNEKDIHPTTFEHRGKRYLLWSALSRESPGKTDVWRINIAPLANPWTLGGRPVVISSPQYEWECQWIDEDGTASPYPSFINEGPAFLYSRDSTRLLVYFAASETYTSYYCEGLTIASAEDDPLNPSSWHKLPEPVFSKSEENGVLGAGHINFFSSGDELYILYNGKSRFRDMKAVDNRSTRMQPVSWGEDGIPELGVPVREDSVLLAPSIAE